MIRPVSRCSWSSGTLLRILGDVWLHLLPTTWVRTTLVKLHSSHHRMQLNRRVAQQFQAVLLDYWVSDSATESSIVREASCFDSVCGKIFLTESPPRNLDKWAILAHYRILDHPWLHLRHLCALGHWSFLYFGLTRLPQSFARLFLVNEGFWIQHTWQKYASVRTMMRARQQRYLTKIEMLSSNSYGRDCIWSDAMWDGKEYHLLLRHPEELVQLGFYCYAHGAWLGYIFLPSSSRGGKPACNYQIWSTDSKESLWKERILNFWTSSSAGLDLFGPWLALRFRK